MEIDKSLFNLLTFELCLPTDEFVMCCTSPPSTNHCTSTAPEEANALVGGIYDRFTNQLLEVHRERSEPKVGRWSYIIRAPFITTMY